MNGSGGAVVVVTGTVVVVTCNGVASAGAGVPGIEAVAATGSLVASATVVEGTAVPARPG